MNINETVIFDNTGNVTFDTPNGTLQIYVQPEATVPIRVMCRRRRACRSQRSAEKAKEPNTYVVQYPIRPGETRIDLSYSMPAMATKFDGAFSTAAAPCVSSRRTA